MSTQGRPKGESSREARSAEGNPMSTQGRPKGESASKGEARREIQ